MKNYSTPIPENELLRLISLSELDLDYTKDTDDFKDLTQLAAKIAGTEISVVNIIDSFTQWSISSFGGNLGQIPREESVCQHTIMSDDPLEVKDLRLDDRFNDMDFVKGSTGLRYYYGLPLKTSEGINIGSLCLVDSKVKSLTPEKVEQLALIAESVVKRIKCAHTNKTLTSELTEHKESIKKAAHDIRGPLAGIIGLSKLMADKDTACDPEQQMEISNMIYNSSQSLLELADNILSENNDLERSEEVFNLESFNSNLQTLFLPQAVHKNVQLTIHSSPVSDQSLVSKNKLIQIAGNLISNAIKFTSSGGKILVDLSIEQTSINKSLHIQVSDNGVGIDPVLIKDIIDGKNETTLGTMGEKGYGYGIGLVVHLVESLEGKISVTSIIGEGTVFKVVIPLPN
jgi:signal transduction histidine kinase